MIHHYLVTVLRTISRNKLITGINIFGLSISLGIFLSFTGYVAYHLNYDNFYPESDRIYRIDYYEFQDDQAVLQSAHTHDRTALLVHVYVPQVEAITRIYNEKAYVFTEDVRLVDQDMLFADSSFFKVFNIKLIEGSAESCLIPPKAVVISRSQALVYFGDESPVGKTLYFNEHLPFTVTGVFEDIPESSSINFDFLLSWSTLSYYGWVPKEGSFRYPWMFTFVKLRENVNDLESINNNLTRLINEQNQDLVNRRHTARYELRPYKSLHFATGLGGEIKPGINKMLLYGLLTLATFILVVAWINYVNLSLARSLERAHEIGVRKVFGASRNIISAQFLLEAILLSLISFLLGFVIFYLVSKRLLPMEFSGIAFMMPSPLWLVIYALGFVGLTALASLYPAWFISRYNPMLILRNKLGRGKGKAAVLFHVLMVFQLILAVSVVGIALIAGKQLQFIQTFNTGFSQEQVINLRAPASTNSDSLRTSRYRAFRNEVLQQAAFTSGTSSMNIPGEEIRFHDENLRPLGSVNEKKQSFQVMWIDEGYQSTFGMTLLGGRNFLPEEKDQVVIINETTARALGYNDPVNAVNTSVVTHDNQTFVIAGVWRDYHHQSLRKAVEPIVFFYRHPHEYGYYSFRVNTGSNDFLAQLQKVWTKHYPNDQFSYYFQDQFYAQQYITDRLVVFLLRNFSLIATLVACLGLFGMAKLMLVKRTSEIGIRKVLGASVLSILMLISGSYARYILISCVFAFPLTWYFAQQWLAGFNYRISLEWWMILVPGLLLLLAMLLTISFHAVKAALTNPMKTLRDQ